MAKLYCQVGDLAIAVNTELPENQGCIVRVLAPLGLFEWSTFGLLPIWLVEVVTLGRSLHYLTEGVMASCEIGPVPDRCLRPITPPQGERELLEEDFDLMELVVMH